jgi:hypothetical protein
MSSGGGSGGGGGGSGSSSSSGGGSGGSSGGGGGGGGSGLSGLVSSVGRAAGDLSEWLLEQDFAGQKLADGTYQWVVAVFSALAFVAGWAQDSFRTTFQLWLVGAIIASALSLVGWPWLRRNPVAWLPSVDAPLPDDSAAPPPAAAAAVAAAPAASKKQR